MLLHRTGNIAHSCGYDLPNITSNLRNAQLLVNARHVR